jgi:hypothetical protein
MNESTALTLKPELIDELLKLTKSPGDLFGAEGRACPISCVP